MTTPDHQTCVRQEAAYSRGFRDARAGLVLPKNANEHYRMGWRDADLRVQRAALDARLKQSAQSSPPTPPGHTPETNTAAAIALRVAEEVSVSVTQTKGVKNV